jgi:hypothetical protein
MEEFLYTLELIGITPPELLTGELPDLRGQEVS